MSLHLGCLTLASNSFVCVCVLWGCFDSSKEALLARRAQHAVSTHICRLPPHDNKLVRTLHKEAGELVAENLLDLIGLFDHDAHPHRVHGWLNSALLPLASANGNGVQKEFLASTYLHLGFVVPLDRLETGPPVAALKKQ